MPRRFQAGEGLVVNERQITLFHGRANQQSGNELGKEQLEDQQPAMLSSRVIATAEIRTCPGEYC